MRTGALFAAAPTPIALCQLTVLLLAPSHRRRSAAPHCCGSTLRPSPLASAMLAHNISNPATAFSFEAYVVKWITRGLACEPPGFDSTFDAFDPFNAYDAFDAFDAFDAT